MRKVPLSVFLLVLGLLFTFVRVDVVSERVLGIFTGLADSPWPMFHGNQKLTGQSPYDTSHVDGSILWRFKAGHWIESSPVVGSDDTIYFADHTCTLYAIDSSGNEKWQFSGGDPVYSKEWKTTSCSQSTPAVGKDGTIYYLPMTGNLFAVNPDGTEKWRYPVFAFKNIWSSPAIGNDGTIYVGSEAYPPSETGKPEEKAAHVYAINPDGTLKWSYDTRSVWVTSTPSIGDDHTIYTSGGIFDPDKNTFVNSVYAFDRDGNVKWTFQPPSGVVEGSIAIGEDDTLYFTVKGEKDPRNAHFYALTRDGDVKWSYPLSQGASATPAVATNGNIYFGDWGGTFYAFSKEGNLLWKVDTPSGFEVLASSPSLGREGTIYFGSTAGYFFAFTPDGEEKWRLEDSVKDGGVIATPAIGRDGTVYITTLQRELLAIGANGTVDVVENTKGDSSPIPLVWFLVAGVVILLFLLRRRFSRRGIFILLITVILPVAVFLLLSSSKSPKEKTFDREFDNPSRREEDDTSIVNVCPDRVYGSEEKGFFGVYTINYGVKQYDLSEKQHLWALENCDETIWPEDMAEGYTGN